MLLRNASAVLSVDPTTEDEQRAVADQGSRTGTALRAAGAPTHPHASGRVAQVERQHGGPADGAVAQAGKRRLRADRDRIHAVPPDSRMADVGGVEDAGCAGRKG